MKRRVYDVWCCRIAPADGSGDYVRMKFDQSQYTLRPAEEQDLQGLASLLPQLADFDVPEGRNPDDLWQGDLALVERLLAGETLPSYCDVLSRNDDNMILGLILVTMQPEALSGEPSAHLEAIAVHPQARGMGLGRYLLEHAESSAAVRGAKSMTLHVFGNNTRARALYRATDYGEEMIRCMKWL